MKKYALLTFLTTIIALGGGVLVANAYIPLVTIPGVTTAGSEVDLSSYLLGMMKFIIAFGGALAVFMAIVGGTQYIAATINPAAKSQAKERVQNALIGLALVLSSYLLLNSINPRLVQFNLLLPPIAGPATNQVATGGIPPGKTAYEFCAPGLGGTIWAVMANSPESLAIERGNAVQWRSSDATIQGNLDRLNTAVTTLTTKLSPKYIVKVNSAYRPTEYQRHLYQIWDVWNNGGLKDNTNPECANVKSVVLDELNKHGLLNTSIVANPGTGNAPHTQGMGVDLTITGDLNAIPDGDGINAFMARNNIPLSWQGIPGDQWHFNLR